MVLQEVNFKDGSRIYYKFKNNSYRRVIQYSSGDCVDNAGKYYYLEELQDYRNIGERTFNALKVICDLTTEKYSYEMIKKIDQLFCNEIYGEYANVFFTVIYLSMVDLEESKKHAKWPGKRLVLESCRQVLLENVSYEDAAVIRGYNEYTPTNLIEEEDYEEDYEEDKTDERGVWTDRNIEDAYHAAYEGYSRLELGLEG